MIAVALAGAIACGILTVNVEREILSVDPRLVRALVLNESTFNPRAVSPAGAVGLTQLMPGTARDLKVCDRTDPAQSLIGGARYLKSMLNRYHGSLRLAIAAYNSGPGAVDRYHNVPPYPETQRYVQAVLGSYARYGGMVQQAPSPPATRVAAVRVVRARPKPVQAFGFAVPNPTNLAIRLPRF